MTVSSAGGDKKALPGSTGKRTGKQSEKTTGSAAQASQTPQAEVIIGSGNSAGSAEDDKNAATKSAQPKDEDEVAPTAVPPQPLEKGDASANGGAINGERQELASGGGNSVVEDQREKVVVDLSKPFKKETIHYTSKEIPEIVVIGSNDGDRCFVKKERCCPVESGCGYDCHNRWFKVCTEKNGKKCKWLNERRCYPKICIRERCERIEPEMTPLPSAVIHWNVMVTKVEGVDGGAFDERGNTI